MRALAATRLLLCGFGGSGDRHTPDETTKEDTCRGWWRLSILAAFLFLPVTDFASQMQKRAHAPSSPGHSALLPRTQRSAQARACDPHRVHRSHPSDGCREPHPGPRGREVTTQPAGKQERGGGNERQEEREASSWRRRASALVLEVLSPPALLRLHEHPQCPS